jgi:hypothetical protein
MTEYVEVPSEIINLNKNVTLAVDIMFVCRLTIHGQYFEENEIYYRRIFARPKAANAS